MQFMCYLELNRKQQGIRVCELLKVYFSERNCYLVRLLYLPHLTCSRSFIFLKHLQPCLQQVYQYLESEVGRIYCETGNTEQFYCQIRNIKTQEREFLKLKRLYQVNQRYCLIHGTQTLSFNSVRILQWYELHRNSCSFHDFIFLKKCPPFLLCKKD